MLAMVAQAPRAFRKPASSLTTIASVLAPTEDQDQKPSTIPCRSELARDGRPGTAGIQAARVIVNDHRERARSYRRSRSKAEHDPL